MYSAATSFAASWVARADKQKLAAETCNTDGLMQAGEV
jgi:hypothetical protein